MLRGFSSGDSRSLRNFRMRFDCGGSSLSSSRAAVADSSIFQAMSFQNVLKRNHLFVATANPFQNAFGLVKVFEVVKVFENGFADVEGFSSSGRRASFSKRFSIDSGRRIASMGTSL